ncbi:hypothetical protein JAAARDRAFT_169256 [Jaapia argillacea MUCL 33604]|uniref:Uncharacterized protein n=1 Tax=Jaapia argillacea MUCL 33604 TaxID=933084 RepID=A0A067Q924_9AGAM|nr:hypothetical protein JAAARDRAFT_169256 [Jaapia argillacea MUCL 33604]
MLVNRTDSSVRDNLFQDDDASSDTSITSSVHDVPKLEKLFYYFDIRGDGCLGPKLIYKTAKDTFTPPTGPENDPRPIRLLQVDDHAQLGKDDLWATVRDKVGELLNKRQILFTSIDLVRFGWEESGTDGRANKVISGVTIWVGVQEDSTTGDVAFESSQDILGVLKQHGIDDIDVAFRESEARLLTGPPLLAPVDDHDHLKNVIHSVTTALGLPIAGEKTPKSQGTLGFYFRIGKDPYGVTARHVLFDVNQANTEYTYPSAPKKNVILMGTKAFDDFLDSIQAEIGSLNSTVTFLKKSIASYTGKLQLAAKLATAEADLEKTNAKIKALKDFFVMMQKDWSDPKSRVIGHVVWAPPITGNTPPHGYTQDVCVIKLNKGRFWPNFVHNVVSLEVPNLTVLIPGVKIDPGKFMSMMYGRFDEFDFDYPVDRHLFKLWGILTAEQINHPTVKDFDDIPVRFVIKNGYSTGTTIGRLNRFESKTRMYGLTGTFDSIEAPVLPYGKNQYFDTFSRGGDSGSIVAGPKGEFVSLLTGGTGPSESVDITFTTPMHWLWNELILVKFPGANLNFDEN